MVFWGLKQVAEAVGGARGRAVQSKAMKVISAYLRAAGAARSCAAGEAIEAPQIARVPPCEPSL